MLWNFRTKQNKKRPPYRKLIRVKTDCLLVSTAAEDNGKMLQKAQGILRGSKKPFRIVYYVLSFCS